MAFGTSVSSKTSTWAWAVALPTDAVSVAVPALTPVMIHWASLSLHSTVNTPSSPLAYSAPARSAAVMFVPLRDGAAFCLPTRTLTAVALKEIFFGASPGTVTLRMAVAPLVERTVMSATPASTAVTRPFAVTVATSGSSVS